MEPELDLTEEQLEAIRNGRVKKMENKTVTKQVSVIYFLQHNETRKIKIGYKPSQSLLSAYEIATRENAVLLETIQASPGDFNRLKKCLNYSQPWENCPFLLKFIKSLDDWCKCCNALMKINISQLLDLMEVSEYRRKQKG